MTYEPQSALAQLAAFDRGLWAAADETGLTEREAVRRLVIETGSSLTTWVLIEETAPRTQTRSLSTHAWDRLAAMPGVVDTRWLAGGRLYLVADPEPFVFALIPSQSAGVIDLISSVSSTDRRWRRLRRWVTRAIAALSPVYLNEDDFLALGDALSEYGRVSTSRLTARDLVDGSSYTRGWPERRQRSRPSHREVLAEAQHLAVRTLTLHVGEKLLVQLRREAGATFYGGDFDVFSAVVLHGLEEAVARRRSLLTGRERTYDQPPPRPLVVRTRGERFAEPDAVFDLLASIDRQPGAGVAIFHRNPYLHATVTDYSDGSNFDVFVTNSDDVIVIPGYRATVTSLARLTDAVGEHVAAVEVDEAAVAPRPTLADLHGDG